MLATGAAGSSAYALSGHVDYRAATAMAIGGMAGAHVGARATARISPSILKLALGVLMIAVAPLLPLRDSFSRNNADPAESLDQSAHVADSPNRDEDPEDSPERSGTGDHDSSAARVEEKRSPTISSVKSKALQKGEVGPIRGTDSGPHHGTAPNFANSSLSLSEGENGNALIEGADCVAIPDLSMVLKMSAIGLGSGFLAGVFGVGGGVVTVPAISLTTDLSHKEVLGTSLAAMVIPALTGSVTHFRQGNLLPRVSVPLAVGTGLGAFFGGNYAARHLDDTSLKWAFAGIMLAMGARTVSAARAASVAAKATRAKF